MAHLVIVVLSVYVTLTLGVDPYGCTYNQADVREYICSARSWSLPLVYSDFVNIPQVLKLVDVDGYLPFQSPATFSGFESMNTSVMDTSIVPALHIRCVSGGSLIMSNGTFSNMGWVKEVRIFDCAILTIPDDVFSSFGTLNYFSIDGGSISNMGVNCFSGVNVERMESVPQPLGMFAIRNSRLTSGELVSGVLYPLINTSIILLENTDMGVINKDLFQTSTRVQYISLKDNPFTYLPDGLFDTVTSLTTFQVSGVNWTCTCKNMWIVTYMKTNNISLIGDIGCTSPEAYNNVKGSLYLTEQCYRTTPCGDKLGAAIGGYCYTLTDLVFGSLLLLTLLIDIIATAMLIHLRRQTVDTTVCKRIGQRKDNGFRWRTITTSADPLA